MALTFLELVEQTRYYLDDDNEERYSNSDEIKNYVNYSYNFYNEELAKRNYPRLLTSSDITLSDYLAELPSDFYSANIVYAKDGNSLLPLQYFLNYDEVEDADSGVSGCTYCFRGNYIKVSGTDATEIKLVYYKLLPDLSLDTDTVDSSFLPSWNKLIPLRAALIAKSTREEEDTTEISRTLQTLEQPFYDYLVKMTDSRSAVQPFII